MSFGNIISSLFCVVLVIGVAAIGSALWLVIRGRPVTLGNIGMMIGGYVRWIVVDLIINMIMASIFGGSNRRRF